jgi:hypothetical protein
MKMKILYLVLAIFGVLWMYGCKADGPSGGSSGPEVRVVGISNLVSDSYIRGDYVDLSVAGDLYSWGFDADPGSPNAYLPIETGKSNRFRVIDFKAGFKVEKGNGGIINSVREIRVDSDTSIIAVEANSTAGSEKLKILCEWLDGNKYVYHDISNINDDSGKSPISVYVKVYAPTPLPDINIYYLYRTTTRFPNLIDTLNKIYYQAVCHVNNAFSVERNPDQAWDKNGNGQLDVYEMSMDTNNEFPIFVNWAFSKGYWDSATYATIVFNKPLIYHSLSGILLPGVTDSNGNVTALGSDADYTVVAHEFLHSYKIGTQLLGGFLRDITDEYNLMCYLRYGTRVLRYRKEPRAYDTTHEESQWNNLSHQIF